MSKKLTLLLILFLALTKLCFSQNKDSLYVFVGERISITKFIPGDTVIAKHKDGTLTKRIYMDGAFKAKYKVLKNVFNQFTKDTIEFEAYDHYGIPLFSKYKYTLLFVVKGNGKLYHEKYLYFEVYQTNDGKWASACNPGCTAFNDDYEKLISISVPVQFKEHIKFDLKNIPPENIKLYYSAPNFKIEDGAAIPLRGTYVEYLFKIEAERILKNRGYFK